MGDKTNTEESDIYVSFAEHLSSGLIEEMQTGKVCLEFQQQSYQPGVPIQCNILSLKNNIISPERKVFRLDSVKFFEDGNARIELTEYKKVCPLGGSNLTHFTKDYTSAQQMELSDIYDSRHEPYNPVYKESSKTSLGLKKRAFTYYQVKANVLFVLELERVSTVIYGKFKLNDKRVDTPIWESENNGKLTMADTISGALTSYKHLL